MQATLWLAGIFHPSTTIRWCMSAANRD